MVTPLAVFDELWAAFAHHCAFLHLRASTRGWHSLGERGYSRRSRGFRGFTRNPCRAWRLFLRTSIPSTRIIMVEYTHPLTPLMAERASYPQAPRLRPRAFPGQGRRAAADCGRRHLGGAAGRA
jgi:hypothetical protein